MYQMEADPVLQVEPSSQSKQETIRRLKRERAKSNIDQESLKQEVFYKMRLVDDEIAPSRTGGYSDGGSLADSDRMPPQRVYRRLSLNENRSEDPLQDFKPFNHKELYPSSIQKYLTNSQKTRQFYVGEAVQKLKTPNSKSHSKHLDKMRLLGLVQEREVDTFVKGRLSISSAGSSVESPLRDFSSVNSEPTNAEDPNLLKPSKFLQEASQGLFGVQANKFGTPVTNQFANQTPQNDLFGRLQAENTFGNGILQMQGTLKVPHPMLNQMYPGNNPNQFSYPQQQFDPNQANGNPGVGGYPTYQMGNNQFLRPNDPSAMEIPNRGFEQPNQTISLRIPLHMANTGGGGGDFPNQGAKSFTPKHNSQGVQQQSPNIKDVADQQLLKINNLLVRKPKRIYKLNTIDVAPSWGSGNSSNYNSPGVDSPNSPMSDMGNLTTVGSFNAAQSISTKTTDCSNGVVGVSSMNSIKADENSKANVNVVEQPNNLAANLLSAPSKKNRKPVYRTNTDPSVVTPLMKTIPSPGSNSPSHSKNSSNGAAYQNLPGLSQFSMMSSNVNAQLGNGISGQFISKGVQTAINRTPMITETLAENLPGAIKKKKKPVYRASTDPDFHMMANSIISPGDQSLYEPIGSQQQ